VRGGRERPKRFAVERSPRLRAVVCAQLRQGWSPASIAGRLPVETAQVPDGDPSFGDVDRWRYYNSNNLWVDRRSRTCRPPTPAPRCSR
jgi:hypothetical protein